MAKKPKIKDLSFEQALEQLEEMVDSMEENRVPLQDLLVHYQQGTELISHCETLLNEAKQKLELITLQPSNGAEADRSNQLDTDEAAASNDDSDDDNDDEIRLF